jgi:hypothetical protein
MNKKIKRIVTNALFYIGLGVMLHDFAHTCWQVGGYSEILSPQGFYVGFILTLIGWWLK